MSEGKSAATPQYDFNAATRRLVQEPPDPANPGLVRAKRVLFNEAEDALREAYEAGAAAGAPKAGEPPQADWLHETDSVKFGLKYIADSPAHEFGGFHPKTFEIAKEALQRIEELERGAGEPPQELVKLVSAVQEFLKHDGGSGSEDYDALKRSEARRSMQSVLGFRCPKCGETLPHLYDENCTDYRVRGAGETPAEPDWIALEVAIRKAKFVREEFPVPCGFPSEIYPQLIAVIRKHLGAGSTKEGK